MIAATRLGLRLGCRAIRRRAGWIAVANAIGMYVVLLSLSIPTSLAQRYAIEQNDRRSLMVLLAIAVALPVVVMLATMSRLSARTWDRRLASLRLMGLRPRDTNIVAAVEASAVAMTGAALGAALFIATCGPLAALLRNTGWAKGTLTLPIKAWLLATGLVFVCATALTVLPARRSGLRNLGQARVGSRGRPPVWRLLPLIAGCSIDGWLLHTRHTEPEIGHLLGWLGAAVLLSGAGIVIATSWMTYALSGFLSALPGVSAQLARRGMRAEPARATRVLSGLLTSAFIGSAALCVMVAWTNTPTFLTGEHNTQHPWISVGLDDQTTPRDLSALEPIIKRAPDVRAVLPSYPISTSCTGQCGKPFIGTCSDLQQLAQLTDCSDTVAAYVRAPSAVSTDSWDTLKHPSAVQLSRDGDTKSPPTSVPVRSTPITARGGTIPAGGYNSLNEMLFIPRGVLAGSKLATQPYSFIAVMNGGAKVDDLNAAIAPHSMRFQPDLNDMQYQQMLIYRRIVWTVITGAILMGVLTLTAATLDHRQEQRRPLASLTMLGTPRRVIRRTVRLQFVIPLITGLTLAVAAGALSGAAYLDLALVDLSRIPWPELFVLAAGSITVAVGASYAVSIGSAARLTATTVRRE